MAVGIILLSLEICIPSISASSNDDITIYISAGIFRERYGTFGRGYVVRVYNNGDDNITGIFYANRTTRSGELIRCVEISFTISHIISFGTVDVNIFDGHPINLISLTVKVGDRFVTKSGYEIGPFVLITK